MAYAVSLTRRAARDLVLLYDEIDAGQSAAALKWYRGLRQAILSLEDRPNRCSRTPEHERLRQLLFGRKPHTYRVIFRVLERQKRVEVLHIRHGARGKFKTSELA